MALFSRKAMWSHFWYQNNLMAVVQVYFWVLILVLELSLFIPQCHGFLSRKQITVVHITSANSHCSVAISLNMERNKQMSMTKPWTFLLIQANNQTPYSKSPEENRTKHYKGFTSKTPTKSWILWLIPYQKHKSTCPLSHRHDWCTSACRSFSMPDSPLPCLHCYMWCKPNIGCSIMWYCLLFACVDVDPSNGKLGSGWAMSGSLCHPVLTTLFWFSMFTIEMMWITMQLWHDTFIARECSCQHCVDKKCYFLQVVYEGLLRELAQEHCRMLEALAAPINDSTIFEALWQNNKAVCEAAAVVALQSFEWPDTKAIRHSLNFCRLVLWRLYYTDCWHEAGSWICPVCPSKSALNATVCDSSANWMPGALICCTDSDWCLFVILELWLPGSKSGIEVHSMNNQKMLFTTPHIDNTLSAWTLCSLPGNRKLFIEWCSAYHVEIST